MVSIAAKIGMATMFSTMAVGSELPGRELGDYLVPLPTAQDVGFALTGILTGLVDEIKEIKEDRAKTGLMLVKLRSDMDMIKNQ